MKVREVESDIFVASRVVSLGCFFLFFFICVYLLLLYTPASDPVGDKGVGREPH